MHERLVRKYEIQDLFQVYLVYIIDEIQDSSENDSRNQSRITPLLKSAAHGIFQKEYRK